MNVFASVERREEQQGAQRGQVYGWSGERNYVNYNWFSTVNEAWSACDCIL